jgi:hypothetical protein
MKKPGRSLAVALLVSALACAAATFAEDSLVQVRFESDPVGPYSLETLKQDWGDVRWGKFNDRAQIVVDTAAEQGKVLRISYPAGAVGPSHGGHQFLVSLPSSEELWLSYRVKFGEGFDFRLGGKLPGLTSGGSKYTGGKLPSSGNGWSARYMWRKGGGAVVYLYSAGMPDKWGEGLLLRDAAFTPGKWHHLTQHIRINAPDLANGVLEAWFDGRKTLSRSDIRFRIGERGLIDSFFFSTFHGGNTPAWAPRIDSFAYFDDFEVSKRPPVYPSAAARN